MATGTVPITPGTGQSLAIDTNASLAGGAGVQIMSLANSDGSRLPADPDGTLQVSPEATTLLLDDFGAQAITVLHAVASGNSGVTPAATNGNVPISAGTASGGWATMNSISRYWLRAFTYLKIAHIVGIEAAATANSTRWWGYGTNQSAPTATAPVVNGAVFLLDSANNGALEAVFYSGGTKTIVATLTRPSDGGLHRYEISYRQSVVYWLIDGLIVATRQFPNLAIATGMYAIAGAANAAAITAPTFNLSAVSVGDLGANNQSISDGVNPGIQATVKAAATQIVGTDFALAVGIHPSSPLPTGANFLGRVAIGPSLLMYSIATLASTNAQSIRAVTSQLQELTVSNPTATAAFLKIYSTNTAPVAGSGTPVMIIRIPAAGSVGDFQQINFGANGKLFVNGWGWTVTANAAASDTTAAVAGILISATYS